MSKRKTSNRATLPESVGSPGSRLRRQQAKGSKMVEAAKSRAARQAKTRTMPKKPTADARRKIAKFFLRRLNEHNCERYGVSKVDIFRLREAWREAANGPR
jgi:hypothetical protein